MSNARAERSPTDNAVADSPPASASDSVSIGQDKRLYAVGKRAFDLVLGALALLASMPIWLVAAIAVKLTSHGPILYGQTRCGRDGRAFTCYKFRTMIVGAHEMRGDLLEQHPMSGPVFKLPNDPRMTPIGRWLRKLSIDELPQLINVLLGDMSIVGPRPAIPEEVAQYTPRERIRLSVKPGLTCLWQVSGRSNISFDQWIEMDIEYIVQRGFWLDCWIVARTVPAVLKTQGAY